MKACRRQKRITVAEKPPMSLFGAGRYGLEYWVHVRRRTGDDLQDIGGGGLPLQRFVAFAVRSSSLRLKFRNGLLEVGCRGVQRRGPLPNPFRL